MPAHRHNVGFAPPIGSDEHDWPWLENATDLIRRKISFFVYHLKLITKAAAAFPFNHCP
jgi:hypothetical protein